jgi:plasmid replication initiation protein
MGQVVGTSVAAQTLKAAEDGNSAAVYKLVRADRTRALRATDRTSGFTALHHACRHGHTAVAWVLLQEDAPTEVVCKARLPDGFR